MAAVKRRQSSHKSRRHSTYISLTLLLFIEGVMQVTGGTEIKLDIQADLLKAICVQTKDFASSSSLQLALKNKATYNLKTRYVDRACAGVICTKKGGKCHSVKEKHCDSPETQRHVSREEKNELSTVTDADTSKSIKNDYKGYKLYRVRPKDISELEYLNKMKKNGVDFWVGPTKLGIDSDLMLSPKQQATYLPKTLSEGLEMKEILADVHELIQKVKVAKAVKAGDLSWDAFYNLDDIYDFIDKLETKYPDKAKVVIYGESYEKRQLKLISISSSLTTSAALRKPIVFIQCNIHAREWITNALCTFLINEILVEQKECISAFLSKFDIYILPVANPDGYAHSHIGQNLQTNRLWRKTRSPNPGSRCIGTDPNRNFDVHWNESGTGSNPCDEDYGGTKSNSEVEVDHLQNYLLTPEISSRLRVYLDVHSYAEAILWPWSYGVKNVSAERYQFFWETSEKAVEAIKSRYDTEYIQGPGYQAYDVNSGVASDWAYDKILANKIGKVFAATMELRNAYGGFIVREKDILPHVLEAMDGICVIIEAVGSDGVGGGTTFKPPAVTTSFTDKPVNPPTVTEDPECDD